MNHGWEWPGPDADPCGATAEERHSGRRIYCGLRKGHPDVHHWERVVGDQLESASWIASGHITFIGEHGKTI